jgi:hypothetical protein
MKRREDDERRVERGRVREEERRSTLHKKIHATDTQQQLRQTTP